MSRTGQHDDQSFPLRTLSSSYGSTTVHTQPLATHYEPPNYPLHDIYETRERTLANKLLWGAAFGIFAVGSQLFSYGVLAISSANAFNATSPDAFNHELDKLSFIPDSSMDSLFGRVFLSYTTYVVAAATLFSLANVAHKAYQSRQKPSDAYGDDFAEIREKDDINQLFNLTIRDDKLQESLKQTIFKAAIFFAFIAPNFLYDYAFKDASADAIKLLPNYGSPLYIALNQEAGPIGFVMNFLLNQWFSFTILNFLMSSYNLTQLKKENYSKTNNVSVGRIASNIGMTLTVSIISSLSFFFLALNDQHLKEKSPAMQFLVPASAFIVYGFVLNTEGSISLLKDISNFWNWLSTMPKPILDLHNEWKEYTGYIFGYIAYNIYETARELAYYAGLHSQYLYTNDLKLPNATNSRHMSLSRKSNIQESDVMQEEDQKPHQPKYTNAELKAEIDKRIRDLPSNELNKNKVQILNELIKDAKTHLETKPASASDVWKFGRIRSCIAKPWALIGPIGLSIVVLGYYFLVNTTLTEKLYQKAFPNMSDGDAAARLLSLYLFSPFVKLLFDSGYSSMANVYAGFEHKIVEIYHSIQIFRGKESSRDISYSDRFHPTSRKELGLFVLGLFIFTCQLTAFMVTPSSAGTVTHLLEQNGLLNSFTKNMAFWFTALFNSFGLSSFLSWGKQKTIERVFYADRQELFQKNNDFFTALADTPNASFDFDDLTEDQEPDDTFEL